MVKPLDLAKPPVPVRVKDLLNFARLGLALSEGSQILWNMQFKGKHIAALFTAYMYWNGDLPLLAYIELDEKPKPFLAYKSDSQRGEEVVFSEDADDTRYKYGSFIEVKKTPKAFEDSLEGIYPTPQEPMLTEVVSLSSIVRILLPLSFREGTIFPLWQFRRREKYIVGTCIPFEHYYEADALPVFFYVSRDEPLTAPFIKYTSSRATGEKLDFSSNTSDTKYFYIKVVDVENLPIFPRDES
jgi:hypothetical protein